MRRNQCVPVCNQRRPGLCQLRLCRPETTCGLRSRAAGLIERGLRRISVGKQGLDPVKLRLRGIIGRRGTLDASCGRLDLSSITACGFAGRLDLRLGLYDGVLVDSIVEIEERIA